MRRAIGRQQKEKLVLFTLPHIVFGERGELTHNEPSFCEFVLGLYLMHNDNSHSQFSPK